MATEHKKVFVGTVVRDKADKTRIIEVRTKRRHPLYKKIYDVTRRFAVHDPQNQYRVGDVVTFQPSKPYSKTKKFIIIGKTGSDTNTRIHTNDTN